MAMTKTTLVAFLSALLICTFVTQDVEAGNVISNPAMQRDTIPCSKKDPGSCNQKPTNTYQRGCETEEKCRGGPGAK
ncbi:putative rapid ALkalinization Factor [Medicago truncatula]|uniref:Putative rapid ALkalinization Factor n=1 Tax=Medicago truncatula TaxID=3880 RepID=A0A072VCK5_MEDTR|nr:RALF [Medicago truncatula]RHN75777.1 putative rapid ALkalinization Factor [Medicago truncatula]